MKRLILCFIAFLVLNLTTLASDQSFYIESLFTRIDRELELGSTCKNKDMEVTLQRLNREYKNLTVEQKAGLTAINKICQKYDCIERAEANYKEAWRQECKNRGLNDNCSLNVEVAKSLDERLRYDKNNCKE